MLEKNKLDLENIIKSIPNKESNIENIYLFGSYAYGTPHKNSDYDVYIVVKDNVLNISDYLFNINYSAYDYCDNIDVLGSYKSKFDVKKTLPTIERTIYNKGIKLYG